MAPEDRSDEGGDPPCWAHLVDMHDTSPDSPAAAGPAELADLMAKLADAVVVCDPSGAITFWNDAATRLLGFAPAPGTRLDVIIPERYRERHWRGWQRVVATGATR